MRRRAISGTVRAGDGTGTAHVEQCFDEEARIRYPSGARRIVNLSNLARPQEPTPAERELLRLLVEAGDAGIEHPPVHLRVAAVYLIGTGFIVDDRPRMLLTAEGEQAAGRLGLAGPAPAKLRW